MRQHFRTVHTDLLKKTCCVDVLLRIGVHVHAFLCNRDHIVCVHCNQHEAAADVRVIHAPAAISRDVQAFVCLINVARDDSHRFSEHRNMTLLNRLLKRDRRQNVRHHGEQIRRSQCGRPAHSSSLEPRWYRRRRLQKQQVQYGRGNSDNEQRTHLIPRTR